MWYGQGRPHEKVTFGQRSEGNETGMYRVWGGWGVAACVGSIPDQLYKKCKAPGRSVCLRNSSKKTSRVTVEWGRAGPVWDESKVACLSFFWFWVFALVFFLFFFLVCCLIWGRQSYKGTLQELSPATGLTSACSWLNLGKLSVCVCVCVCVCVFETDLRIFYLQVFQNIL